MTSLKLAICHVVISSLLAMCGSELHAQKRQTVRWHKIETKNKFSVKIGIAKAIGGEKRNIKIQLESLAKQLQTVCQLDASESAPLPGLIETELAKWEEARTAEIKSMVEDAIEKGLPHASVDTADQASLDLFDQWIDVFRTQLGNQNRELIDAWVKQRVDYQRKSAVQSYLVDLDRRMYLSPEQFLKLESVVDQVAGKQLYLIRQYQTLHFVTSELKEGKTEAKFVPLVNGFLSESQLTEWKLTVDRELQNLQNEPVPEKIFGLNW